MGKAETISSRDSQGLVLRPVGPLNRLEEQIEPFVDSTTQEPNEAEATQEFAEDMWIAAPCGKFSAFLEERDCVIVQIANASEVIHDQGAHGCSLGEALWRLRERGQVLPNALPVPERIGRIVGSHPLGR